MEAQMNAAIDPMPKNVRNHLRWPQFSIKLRLFELAASRWVVMSLLLVGISIKSEIGKFKKTNADPTSQAGSLFERSHWFKPKPVPKK